MVQLQLGSRVGLEEKAPWTHTRSGTNMCHDLRTHQSR